MNLFKASNQWATRPADERFWTLEEGIGAGIAHRESSIGAQSLVSDLRVEANEGEIQLVGKQGIPAKLTHWSFGQLARRAAPKAVEYLRGLPATLAVQNLNHGLRELGGNADERPSEMLFHKNGSMVLRGLTGPDYQRVWNHELLERLAQVLPQGWKAPPARPAPGYAGRTRFATEADIGRISSKNGGGIQIKVGDEIAPAGIYVSDHDCFVFMVNEEAGIDDGTGHQLGRGFFVFNSEVGAMSLGVMSFLYDSVCGNHIVWNVKDVKEVRLAHRGKGLNQRAFGQLTMSLTKYANESANETEAKILEARKMVIAATKDDVLDALFGKVPNLSMKVLDEAYDAAEQSPRYGAPNTVWGMVNGLTEVSQKSGHTDERVKIDRAAGELARMAF